MLRMRVVERADAFQALRESWRELWKQSPGATPFQTFEWQSLWLNHFGRGARPVVLLVEEGDDLVGLMPFVRRSGPWRTLRPMGIGPSDYLQPLARAGYEERVAVLLARSLREFPGCDLVDLHQLRETRSLAEELPGLGFEQAACLVLDLPPTFDAYLATLSKSLRYDVRRLGKSPEFSVETSGPEALDILFDLHARRWRKRGLPGAFLGKQKAFHREWAEVAQREGWLRLSTLKKDGASIGAIYAMTTPTTCYYYQAGFDPAHQSVSPGTMVVADTIRAAIEDGRTQFDFMRGDEPYKRRWKPQHRYANLRFVLASPGFRGDLASGWNLAGNRLESGVRARLEGKGLW